MSLPAGTMLGPYEILEPIGAGGMGQVFRGIDTRLGRHVAIKRSHEDFTDRFEREARAISALNHTHICTLYDVGPNYLVMELVEGETLTARIKRGKLPMPEVFRYGMQIADALAAAHAKGIVHRDLKPGNIMLTKAGVKVLDFGLAKSQRDDETLTLTNAVMGTPAYMAPEQREGRACDGRADIYALGLVLAEMATGKRQSREGLSGYFAHIVERCLAEDREDRWQAASDVKAELSFAAGAPAGAAPAMPGGTRMPWVIAGLACLGVLAGGAWEALHRAAPPPDATVRFTLTLDGQLADGAPEPSPNGRYLAANPVDPAGKRLLWVRAIDEAEGRWIAGSEGAGVPFWSPDSRWIAFFAQGRIKKVSPTGGSPQSMVEVAGVYTGAWNAQGDIIFAPVNRSELFRVKDSGGTPQAITKLDAGRGENSHRWVRFLPDGKHYIYTARCTDAKNNALYLGSLDSTETRRLMEIESQAQSIPGALLFVREGTLFRQDFDGEKVTGEPQALAENVLHNTISAQASFGASADGRVLLVRAASSGGNSLTWTKRDGTVLGTLGSPGVYFDPRFSPDGGHLIFDRPDGDHGNRDIWMMETRSAATTRITTDPANDMVPIWSGDGKQIVFQSDRASGAVMGLFQKGADGAAGERKLDLKLPTGQLDVTDWSRDGRWLAFQGHAPPENDIVIAPLAQDRPAFRFISSNFTEVFPRFSPDGKWIAYQSNESGRGEIYVRAFAGSPADSIPAIQLTNNGGGYHEWSSDGTELFYLASDFKMYSVRTRDLKVGSVPPSTLLFTSCPATQPYLEPLGGKPYAVSPDERFLILCRSGQSSFVVRYGKPLP